NTVPSPPHVRKKGRPLPPALPASAVTAHGKDAAATGLAHRARWPMTEADKETVEILGSARSVASSSVRVNVHGLSHPGRVRSNNEDYFLVARFGRTMQTLLTNLPPGEVPEQSSETVYGLAVADGMGGEAAGEVASRTALRTMID